MPCIWFVYDILSLLGLSLLLKLSMQFEVKYLLHLTGKLILKKVKLLSKEF